MKHLPYDRAYRVGQAIFELVATLCRDRLSDPRLQGIQITGSKVTKDLRLARIYYFIRGDMVVRQGGDAALQRAGGLIKRAIAERLSMKFTPEVEFFFDDSIEHGERIGDLLEKLTEHGKR